MSNVSVKYFDFDPKTFEPAKAVITVEGEALTAECVRRVKAALLEGGPPNAE